MQREPREGRQRIQKAEIIPESELNIVTEKIKDLKKGEENLKPS